MKEFNKYLTSNIFLFIFLLYLLSGCNSDDATGPNGGPTYDERNISRREGISSDPAVVVDNAGNVHVIWKDKNGGYHNIEEIFRIFYRERKNGIWQDTVALTDTILEATNPDITVSDNGNLYAVWERYYEGGNEIDFAERIDGEWSEPVVISGNSGGNETPQICLDASGNIYVSWMGGSGGISFNKRVGGIWDGKVDVPETMGASNPRMFVEDNGEVHIVYDDIAAGGEAINYLYSPDGGNTWEEPVEFSNEGIYYDWVPDVTACGERVWVVWTRSKYGEGMIGLCMKEKDTSGVWGDTKMLSFVGEAAHAATINTYGNYIYFTWTALGDGAIDVFLNRKPIGGDWEESRNVSNTSVNSLTMSHDIFNSRVYIPWFEKLSDENWDIYFDEINP